MTVAPVGRLEALRIPVGDLRFDAIACGPSDGPLVLFLHGFPAFADCWTDTLRAVALRGYRAVAVDQRGYSPGARPTEIGDYAGPHLVADVLGFASHLGGGEAFHLVGHDFGAYVAWLVAARHPDRLRSLSALSTPHPTAFTQARFSDPDQKSKSAYIDLFRRPGHVAETELLRDGAAALRTIYADKVPAAAVARNVERLGAPGALTAALNWYRALERGESVGAVAVPTLYIWSDGDTALGATAARATERHVTGPYRFEVLENRSHWLPDEAAGEISALILPHLDRYR